MDVQQLRAEAYVISGFDQFGPVSVIAVETPQGPPCLIVESERETWVMHPALGDHRSVREIIRDGTPEDLAQRLHHPFRRPTFHANAHRLRVARAIHAANAAGLLE